jgi:hypothetical protein
MMEQYLPQTNEIATVKKIREPNQTRRFGDVTGQADSYTY